MSGPIAPVAPYAILFRDELERQSVERAQLGELRDIAIQHGPIKRGHVPSPIPPAKLQVDADQLDEQSASVMRCLCSWTFQKFSDVARTIPVPSLLKARIRDSNSSSGMVQSLGQEVTYLSERASNGAFRTAGVGRDFRELGSLQPEFEHASSGDIQL